MALIHEKSSMDNYDVDKLTQQRTKGWKCGSRFENVIVCTAAFFKILQRLKSSSRGISVDY